MIFGAIDFSVRFGLVGLRARREQKKMRRRNAAGAIGSACRTVTSLSVGRYVVGDAHDLPPGVGVGVGVDRSRPCQGEIAITVCY